MIFLVGHRASGKTEAATFLKNTFGFLHIETGDIVRNYKQATAPLELSMGEWEQEIIAIRGPRFIDDLIINSMDCFITRELDTYGGFQDLLITGNRQLEGIDTIMSNSHKLSYLPNNHRIIVALTATEEVLYSRYINRKRETDDTTLSFEEFQVLVLGAERQKGLTKLMDNANYTIVNDQNDLTHLHKSLKKLFAEEIDYHPQEEREL